MMQLNKLVYVENKGVLTKVSYDKQAHNTQDMTTESKQHRNHKAEKQTRPQYANKQQ